MGRPVPSTVGYFLLLQHAIVDQKTLRGFRDKVFVCLRELNTTSQMILILNQNMINVLHCIIVNIRNQPVWDFGCRTGFCRISIYYPVCRILPPTFFMVFLETNVLHVSCYPVHFFIVFLETTFLHVSCYPALFIVSRRYISVFRSLHLPLDAQFWTRGFPLVMQSRKAGLPLATRSRKRELCL